MNLHVHTAPLEGEAFYLSTGHRHAHEAIVGLGNGLSDVCDWYSQPSFHLSHCLIAPNQTKVSAARKRFAEGIALLHECLETP